MKALMLAYLAVAGIFAGYVLGTELPPCCPGIQRGCSVESGSTGVQYCRRSGFGWERCQELKAPYPQALWRSE